MNLASFCQKKDYLQVLVVQLSQSLSVSDAGHERVNTLGHWSDFIKEFGFVLPKQSKYIQSMTKMQMRAHESQSAPFGGAL